VNIRWPTLSLDHADDRGVAYTDPESFDSVTGKGVRATVDGSTVLVGKPGWLEEAGIDLSAARDEIERLQERGLTVSGVVRDGVLVGLLGIGDELKADATETVQRITDAGIAPVMITGDNERTAQAVADDVGIDRVMADVLPDEKREEIGRLQDDGHRVAMVGDGINDAPALTQADIGIAIGAGTDIAIESADIVLMGDRLGGVMDAYEIGKESYRKTRQNLIVAFSFNGIGVAAATTGLVHPVFAMIAMVLSVSAVLANSFGGQLLLGRGRQYRLRRPRERYERERSNDGRLGRYVVAGLLDGGVEVVVGHGLFDDDFRRCRPRGRRVDAGHTVNGFEGVSDGLFAAVARHPGNRDRLSLHTWAYRLKGHDY